MRCGKLVRLAALLGAFSLVLTCFFAFVRPWYRTWGATEIDQNRLLPGDDIIPGPEKQETRVVTIKAPIDQVWPWLAQIGQDRAGFYTFDLLENLVGCRMPSGDRLLPDKQAWKIGDKLWMYPPEKAGGVGFATLRTYVPGRALCFATHAPGTAMGMDDGSWSFILEPLDERTTRLLIRGRGPTDRSRPLSLFDQAIFEPMHFVMERGMMTGLKNRAEGSAWPSLWNDIQVALWLLVFTMIGVGVVQVFRTRNWGRPLAGFVLACGVFQILTFGQPYIAVGGLLTALLVAIPWWLGGNSDTGGCCS